MRYFLQIGGKREDFWATLPETEFAAVDDQSEQIIPSARRSITAGKSYMPVEYGKAYGVQYGT